MANELYRFVPNGTSGARVYSTNQDGNVVSGTLEKAHYTEDDVRRLYMRLWLRHTHTGHPAPKVEWSAEDDAALKACASVVSNAP